VVQEATIIEPAHKSLNLTMQSILPDVSINAIWLFCPNCIKSTFIVKSFHFIMTASHFLHALKS